MTHAEETKQKFDQQTPYRVTPFLSVVRKIIEDSNIKLDDDGHPYFVDSGEENVTIRFADPTDAPPPKHLHGFTISIGVDETSGQLWAWFRQQETMPNGDRFANYLIELEG